MGSNSDMQQAVLELVTLHTDFKQLLAEEGATAVNNSGKSTTQGTTRAYTEAVLHSVELGSGSERAELVSASLMCGQLQSLLSQTRQSLILTADMRKEVSVITESIQHLQQRGTFSQQHFVKLINKQGQLPLELIWLFHESDIMPLESYITCNLERAGVIGRLAQDVTQLCGSGHNQDVTQREAIVTGLMQVLLAYGYGEIADTDNSANKGLRKVACALLDSITKKSLQTSPDLSVYHFLSRCSDVTQAGVKRYTARQLSIILSHRPQYKVSEALQQQPGWGQAKIEPQITHGFSQLLSTLTAEEVLGIFRTVIEEEEVNWRNVLTLTSVFLTAFKDASTLLQGFCRHLITSSLDESELDGLITGFLLARQAALEGGHVFPNYQQWFYSVFGEPHTSPANNKKTFGFLLKFLGDIVPYEPVPCLKAHLLKPPFVPARCRPLLSDYLTLVKTRLMDLGQTLEDSSIFGDRSASTDVAGVQVCGDIEAAVESYRKSGKIPGSVMEASIFRKPYFVGRFLPCLLKPRPLPDPPDMRMRLIDSLQRADKIPRSLMSVYNKECQALASQLLQGVFTDDDEEMEDLTLSPWQQLDKSLENFKASVLNSHTPPVRPSISSQLSVVYDKCCQCLPPGGATLQSDVVMIHTDKPEVQQTTLKVVDALLQTVGEILNPRTSHPRHHSKWLPQLVAMMTRHAELARTLYTRILDLLTRQGHSLSRPQVAMVASLCVHILSGPDLTSVKVNDMTFTDYLTSSLQLGTRDWVACTLRFLVEYLTSAVQCFPSVLPSPSQPDSAFFPPQWCRLFEFLHRRLSYSSSLHLHDMEVVMETARELRKCPELQHLWESHKLEIEEWLELELCISATDDFLSPQQRLSYQEDLLFGEWVPQLTVENSETHWSLKVATQVALAMLRHSQRSKPQGFCSCSPANSSPTQLRPDIVCLLQRVLTFLPPSPPAPHWLPGLFSAVRGNADTCRNSLTWLLSLCDILPPHLLVVNSTQQKSLADVNAIVTLINTVWRDFCTEGFVLSKHRCHYVAQAMVATRHLASDWLMIASCPVIMASLNFHWAEVKTLFDHAPDLGYMAEIIQPIRDLHTICSRCGGEDFPGELFSSRNNCPDLTLVSALLGSFLRNDLTLALVMTMATHAGVNSVMCKAILSQLAWGVITNQPLATGLCELLVSIVTSESKRLDLESTDEFRDVCPDYVLKLWPCVLLRVFQTSPPHTTAPVCNNSTTLSLLLQSHILATRLYNTGIQTTGPLQILCSEVQPLSLTFLCESGDWLKQRLRQTPSNVKVKVNKALVAQCDPDIRLMFNK